jgi:multisubunit Na+/H+ antiporter MnhB subunit
MTWTTPDGNGRRQSLSARLLGAFSGPRPSGGSSGSGGSGDKPDAPEVLPPEERKVAMSTLDPQEANWTLGAFVLATVAGIAIPVYIIAENKVTRRGKNTIAVAPDAKLLGGVILLLCILGFLALWKRKRTFIAFDLFLLGFGFTLFVGLVGFVFILLGGWLMLRAWRINKYGTTNAKAIAKEAAARPRGRERKEAAKASGKASVKAGTPKAPTANKRYTPKAPPRKKVPKPTD